MPIIIEKWINGKTYSVERNAKGHFVKGSKRVEIGVKPKGTYGAEIPHEKEKMFYRCSWNIKGIPVHHTPQNPHYYGFLIQGFSDSREKLLYNKDYLRALLINSMRKYLISQNYVDDLKTEINWESPQTIPTESMLNNRWKLFVEHNGSVIYEDGGTLR